MQQEANVMKTTTSTKRHNLTRIAMYCSIMGIAALPSEPKALSMTLPF